MLKALIVDDEKKSRETLKDIINMYCPTVHVIDLCDSVNSAIKSINKQAPDLVFLDIEMPFDDGFSLLEKITDPIFSVIFTTAYDQYAIKAIKYSALDYLLKPVDAEELVAAVEKVNTNKANAISSSPNLELLLTNLKAKSNRTKIAIPTFEGFQMINADEIIKCIADDRYTHIKLIDGNKLTVSRTLKEYEELLSDLNFYRVHDSCLINITHIVKYIKGDGGYVIMADGSSVEVSRRKKPELLTKLSKLLHY